MPKFIVESVSHVTVDGIPAGRLCDVLSNYRKDIAEIQDSAEDYERKQREASKEFSVRLDAARQYASALLGQMEQILADDKIEDGERVNALRELHAAASLPEKERKALAHEQEIERLQKEVDKLRK